MKDSKRTKYPLVCAGIAVMVASLCCVWPLGLLVLGLGGAWVGTLTQLTFLRPLGIALAIIFLVLAFWRLHITPKRCSIDKLCTNPKALRIQRIIFWIIVVLLALLLTSPLYAFLFY